MIWVIFVNTQEHFTVKPNMAFTLEPRAKAINNPLAPLIAFHTIVLIHKNGEKELLTDFDKIFKLAHMEYIFDH